mgnify:CR=1 FL=1
MNKLKGFCKKTIISVRYRLGLAFFWCKIKSGKNIFVFGAPFHANMGDHAQSYCTEKWLTNAYPGYQVRIYETTDLTYGDFSLLRQIRKFCNKSDKVFLHSGYHTTDLYMLEENMQRMVIQLFSDRQVVILPQTIFYQTDKEKEKSIDIYNKHPNLLLMCRDEVSYNTANSLFPQCRKLLMPDIVTTMIGSKCYQKQRKGILLCLRNDKESFYSSEQIDILKKTLETFDTVTLSDTTISADIKQIRKEREKILTQIWEEYAGYRAIVTDRYHGTIFSLIAGTPVVVISSSDHKLSSGVKWFPESFKDYICYEPSLANIHSQIKRIYETTYTYSLPPYFLEHHYANLRKTIEE